MQRPSIEELKAMTLQIGLLGSDGRVIASDRRLNSKEGESYSRTRTSKFLHRESCVCCWSGDTMAEHAAQNVREINWTSATDVTAALIEAGNKAYKQRYGTQDDGTAWAPIRKVIVACPDNSLWGLNVLPVSTITPVQDVIVSGDSSNTARFFSNNYVPWPPRPIRDLIVMAAYVVLMGGKDNHWGVDGLEVVVIPNGVSPVFLSREQELQLEAAAKKIDSLISKRLLQSFDYQGRVPQ